jgi:hypothetical protein
MGGCFSLRKYNIHHTFYFWFSEPRKMSASKPESKTYSNKENDEHPGDCSSNTCPFQVTPKTATQQGVLCYGCGYFGSAVDAKIIACYHFARFAGLGVAPDQKFVLVKVRPIVDSPSCIFWITTNNTENLIAVTKFFQDLVKKKNLPGLSLDEAGDGQALAHKIVNGGGGGGTAK